MAIPISKAQIVVRLSVLEATALLQTTPEMVSRTWIAFSYPQLCLYFTKTQAKVKILAVGWAVAGLARHTTQVAAKIEVCGIWDQ